MSYVCTVSSPLGLLEWRRNTALQGYRISILQAKQITIITTITIEPL